MKNIEYITAGAGSGKTYTLTEKLSDEIQNGLQTDQVILTTFTKAAAEEFKIKAADKLSQNGLKTQAQQLSGAMIGTIDSVSQFFVQKYWYLLGMSPELNVMGDTELNFYQVNSLIDSKLITPKALSLFEKVRKTFSIEKNENFVPVDYPDFWKDDLLKVISLCRNYGINALDESKNKSFALIDSVFDKEGSINWNHVLSPISPAKKFKKNKGQQVAPNGTKDFSLNSSNKDFSTLVDASDLIKEELFWDGTTVCDRSSAKVTDDSIRKTILEIGCLKYINTCQDYLQSTEWRDLLKEYVETICNIATDWQNQYADYKRKHHLVDFNDIELKFKELLAIPQVAEDISKQYKLVMVDEFQDCNPLQVEIFDTLSDIVAKNGGKSIWVGDEKQSIYGFRGSDMKFIQAVIGKFPASGTGPDKNGLSQRSLDKSYRSRKKLVEKANEIVDKLFSGTGKLNPTRMVGTVDDLDNAWGCSVPAIYNWHSESTNKGKYYEDLAKQVQALINGAAELKESNTWNTGKVSAGDIAILARSKSDVNTIVDALNSVGVKVNAVEGDIMCMAEIQLLMAILNYAINKSNYSRAQILYLWENKKVEDIIADRINDVDWKSVQIISDIDKCLLETKGFSVFQLVESLLLRLDIWNHVAKWGNVSRRHANINTFLRIVQGYEEHTRLLDLACSVMGFINYVNSDSVSADTPFVKDPEAVSVITYHKSKGLEWPVVILCSLERDPLDEQNLIKREFFGVHNYATDPSAVSCSARGEYITIFPQIVSGNSNLPDILKNKISSRVQSGGDIYEKIKAEEARLLYVGFTRARDFVITLDKGSYALLDTYDITKNIVKENDTDNVILYTKIPVQTAITVNNTYDIITETPRNTVQGTSNRYVSPSKLGHSGVQATIQTPVGVSNQIIISVGKVPMNEVGTCIHDIYAVYDDKIADADMIAKAEQVCDMHNRSDIKQYSKDFVDAIKKLYAYLTKNYGQYSAIYHELPVLHKTQSNQIVNGEIDLLWCLSDNEAVIVDFKSMKDDDQVATDEDLVSKASSYAPQLYAYKEAVEKNGITVKSMILFFPLQGKVVEIK